MSMVYDKVRPPHYGGDANPFEPRKVIRAWDLNFNLGTAVKHIARAGKKPDMDLLTDLLKARQYLEFEIDAIADEMKSSAVVGRR